jgi:hypothetical protein
VIPFTSWEYCDVLREYLRNFRIFWNIDSAIESGKRTSLRKKYSRPGRVLALTS